MRVRENSDGAVVKTRPPEPHAAPVFDLRAALKCTDCGARHLGMCDAVFEKDLAQLSAAAQTIAVPAGQRFIEEADDAENFYVVTAGTAKLLKMLPDGRQQITSFAVAGAFLGLAVSAHYAYSAQALNIVKLCRFSRPRLRRLISDFPAMEQRLLESTCHELVLAQEQMLLLGRKTAGERLASFLVRLSAEGAPCAKPATTLHLPMTRADIADYLGLTIETVSRTFTRFKAAGLLALPSFTDVIILDGARLASLADGEP